MSDSVTEVDQRRELASRLRALRERCGLSRALAGAASMNVRRLVALERGTGAPPSGYEAMQLAHAFGIPVSELVPPDLVDALERAPGTGVPSSQRATLDSALLDYLAMLGELRQGTPVTPQSLRTDDVSALALALGQSPESVTRRLVELLETTTGNE